MKNDKVLLFHTADGPESISIYTNQERAVVDFASHPQAVYVDLSLNDASVQFGPFQLPHIYNALQKAFPSALPKALRTYTPTFDDEPRDQPAQATGTYRFGRPVPVKPVCPEHDGAAISSAKETLAGIILSNEVQGAVRVLWQALNWAQYYRDQYRNDAQEARNAAKESAAERDRHIERLKYLPLDNKAVEDIAALNKELAKLRIDLAKVHGELTQTRESRDKFKGQAFDADKISDGLREHRDKLQQQLDHECMLNLRLNNDLIDAHEQRDEYHRMRDECAERIKVLECRQAPSTPIEVMDRAYRGQAIKPVDIADEKLRVIPSVVIEAFNEEIAKAYVGNAAHVRQDDVVANLEGRGWQRSDIFANHWLDVEQIYQVAGWKVEYDKPAYNDIGGHATFVFSKP